MKILVTGATGFIGQELCRKLLAEGFLLRAVVRNERNFLPLEYRVTPECEIVNVGDINEATDWQKALIGVEVVIHLAGIAHITGDKSTKLKFDIRRVNVEGLRALATASAKAGVRRLVYISSIKVNGERSDRDHPFNEQDAPAPGDLYGISKRDAEEVLTGIARQTGLEAVILRPPLVYGPGVKANFRSLMKLAQTGFPLPFKDVKNRRSFIYLDNFIDAIRLCAVHPKAAGETFLVSDGEDVSTPDLIRMIAMAKGKKPALFSFPLDLLRVLHVIIGKADAYDKLTGSLCVDSSKIRNLLGWTPPFTLQEGIQETVRRDVR